MKHTFKFLWHLSIFLFAIQLQAQECNDDTHSINIQDSWLSCEIAASPNANRPDSHWIMYDFGYVYSIGTTQFWNYNVAGETGKGLKNIIIDYSLDGITWMEAATFQLGVASGLNTYIGEAGPDLNDIDARYILITIVDIWGNGSCAGLSEVRFDIGETTDTPQKIIDAKVLLEGAYLQNGMMKTNLQASNLLPNHQPFNRSPWFYNGNESAVAIPVNATDWVLLEVRDMNNNSQIIEQRAAFLSDAGFLMDVDGALGVTFQTLSNSSNYQLIVRSRNHLAVASANTIVLPQATFYDMTVTNNVANGNIQLKETADGYFAMKAGDLNSDGVITVADFNGLLLELSSINEFLDSDFTLDGHVTVDDFNAYLPNVSAIGINLVRY